MEASVFENKEKWNKICENIEAAEFVLIGIGEEFRAAAGADAEEKNRKILEVYNRLEKLVNGKPYFVVTQNEDDLIFKSDFLDFFIASPMGDEKRQSSSEEQWDSYLNWLTATLNHKLCMLELGVGFSAPQIIRWPFEKTAMFHLKSTLVRVNEKFPQLTSEIAERGVSVKANSMELFAE